MLNRFLWLVFYIPFRILFPTKVVGKNNLIKKGRVIFSANHQSCIDPAVFFILFPRRQYYMAKREIFKNILSAWFFGVLGAFPVDRGNIDLNSMRKTKQIMDAEKALTIFPQGTRKKMADDFEGMKNGAVYIAIKNKAPIQPMFFIKKTAVFRPNILVVGKPIVFEEYFNSKPTKELLKELSERLIEQMNNLKNEYILKIIRKKYKY